MPWFWPRVLSKHTTSRVQDVSRFNNCPSVRGMEFPAPLCDFPAGVTWHSLLANHLKFSSKALLSSRELFWQMQEGVSNVIPVSEAVFLSQRGVNLQCL